MENIITENKALKIRIKVLEDELRERNNEMMLIKDDRDYYLQQMETFKEWIKSRLGNEKQS